MNDRLLSLWNSSSNSASTVIVQPDGCRDLIMKVVNKGRPKWQISPLFDQAKTISIEANSVLSGFRMKPGVQFEEEKLLISLQQYNPDINDISNYLTDYSYRKPSVEEALNCLATDASSVMQAAKNLGVSSRTLQRLLLQNTLKPPTYWMLLARARRTARALTELTPLAELAEIHGYADQSHMNREFRRWFNTTPVIMRASPETLRQLSNEGYD